MNESCANCYYWRDQVGRSANIHLEGRKECKRRAPFYGHPTPYNGFPQTQPDEWCGDWREIREELVSWRSENSRPLTDSEMKILYAFCQANNKMAYDLLRRLVKFGVIPDPPPFI